MSPGDPVRLSELGKITTTTAKQRQGRVVTLHHCADGITRVVVQWEGLKTKHRYHPDFVEVVPLPPETVKRFAHVEVTEP